MRVVAVIFLLVAGCAVAPRPLSSFRGWSWRDIGSHSFQIFVGDGEEDKSHEAFLYAATLTLERGYRSFIIMHEDGSGESGTVFSWNLGYVPDRRRGLMIFQPGKFFTIHCKKKRPSDTEELFDAVEQLRRKKPRVVGATPAGTTLPVTAAQV